MLENYTDRAKDLMSDAQNILRRYKHSQLDTEHLLVAMLEDTDGIVTKLLGHLNTDITSVKRVIETNPDAIQRRTRATDLHHSTDEAYPRHL